MCRVEVDVSIIDSEVESGGRCVGVRKGELFDIVSPEAVALVEIRVRVVKRKQIPEERNQHEKHHHPTRYHDFPTLVLQLAVAHQIVVRGGGVLHNALLGYRLRLFLLLRGNCAGSVVVGV